jgi:hypothetical protein
MNPLGLVIGKSLKILYLLFPEIEMLRFVLCAVSLNESKEK